MSQQSEKLTNIMLNGKNYLPWARTVTRSLSGRSKLEYVTGEIPKPVPKVPGAPDAGEKKAIADWQKNDHLVSSWLLNCMEPAVADLCMYKNTAHEIWEKFEKLYGQKNDFARIFQLQQEIQQTKQQPNQTVTEILSQIQKKRDELRSYRPPTTNLEEIQKREEQDEIFQFLASLDSSYEAVRSQILLLGEFPLSIQLLL